MKKQELLKLLKQINTEISKNITDDAGAEIESIIASIEGESDSTDFDLLSILTKIVLGR